VKSSELESPPTPGVWRAGFGAPPAKFARAGDARDYIGPFVSEKRDALLEGVTLAGVVWAGAAPLAAGLHPLVSADEQPLIALVGQRPDSGILFNLDLERTNLIRAPDWPILISNLVEMRRQSLPGPERWNYRIGEWIRIRLGRDPHAPLRIRYSGMEHALPSGSSLEFAAPAPGGLLQVLEGKDVLYELGVNFFDEQESDLRTRSTSESGKFENTTAGLRSESGPESDPLFWTLVVLAVTALTINWFMFSPRYRKPEAVHG